MISIEDLEETVRDAYNIEWDKYEKIDSSILKELKELHDYIENIIKNRNLGNDK